MILLAPSDTGSWVLSVYCTYVVGGRLPRGRCVLAALGATGSTLAVSARGIVVLLTPNGIVATVLCVKCILSICLGLLPSRYVEVSLTTYGTEKQFSYITTTVQYSNIT